MPELPEVETTRRGIDAVATGHRLKHLVVHETRMRWPIPSDMALQVQGQVVRACRRRGKYLLLEFDEGTQLVHLGMSGSLRSVMQGELLRKHDHVEWVFDHATLRLHDPRRFGAVLWHPKSDGPVEHHPL
ncbi:MAG: DNA-formamidopyrimidine glycosylase family protein, partial [Zwartia sp.]